MAKSSGIAALAPNYSRTSFYKGAAQAKIGAPLARALDGLGNALGRTIGIQSGYRSPAYNKGVGGAKSSYHTKGLAADIDMTGWSEADRQRAVAELAAMGVGGFITYSKHPNMLHVDMRPPTEQGPLFMHDKTARLFSKAPSWMKEVASTLKGKPGKMSLPETMEAPKTLAQTRALDSVANAYADPPRALDAFPARPTINPPGNFASPPSVPSIGSAPLGQVTRAPLGPVQKTLGETLRGTYAKTDALGLMPGSLASPTMASAMDPGRFGGATISHLTSQTNAVRPSFTGSLPSAPRAALASPVATRPETPAVTGLPAARMQSAVMSRPSTPAPTGLPAARMQSAVMSRPATPSPTGLPSAVDRSVAPSNPGQLGGITMSNPQGMGGPGGMYVGEPGALLDTPQTPPTARTPPALVAPPAAVLAPALAPPSTVSNMNVASIPSAPRATAMDVYSGLATQGVDSVGNTIGRLSNGTTTVTNKYGVTTGMTPGGYSTAVGSIPGISAPSMKGIGGAVKGAIPGVAGSAIGGVLAGPLGALAGGLLAKALTQPGGPLSKQNGFNTDFFGKIATNKAVGGLGFAPAPSGGYGSGGKMGASFSNRSAEGMRGISPGAASAIGKGLGGLY